MALTLRENSSTSEFLPSTCREQAGQAGRRSRRLEQYGYVVCTRFVQLRIAVAMEMYTPVRFYRPAFYAYAYRAWLTPVSYSWGWAGSPWFGFYGGYFRPYRVYKSTAFPLTASLFAMTLQEAYQERMDANLQGGGYAAGGPIGLTPEVKQLVADEVHRQLDQKAAEGHP